MKIKFAFILFVLSLGFSACRKKAKPVRQVSRQEMEKIMLEYNKRLNEFVANEITTFAENDSLTYQKSNTGLYYSCIHAKPDGKAASSATTLAAELTFYRFDSLSMQKIYEPKIETFALGKHQLPAVNQAVMIMHEGERYRLLVSPALGYGNDGDRKSIPPARPFAIDIHLLKVN